MKRTEKNVQKIREALNNSAAVQNIMGDLIDRANANGISAEQFEDMKAKLMTSMFFKMCEMIPEIKQDLADDLCEEMAV